jgi:chloramphenicol-sensitive protein RarD
LSRDSASSAVTRGTAAAAVGFLLWGAFPAYWKQMEAVSAFELIAQRILWSLVLLLPLLVWRGTLAKVRLAFAGPREFGRNLLSAVLLAANWTTYVWAVNTGHIIESSLGYFLTPLCNVALGALVLHERLRSLQWSAIALAAAGVAVLLFRLGHVPFIAFTLAATWSSYGFLKKQSSLGPMSGLTAEAILLVPFAAGALLWWHHTGEGALGRVDYRTHLFILSSGIVTAVPLLLFAHGAQRIRLSTIGLLQFIAPTVQFLIGLLIYRETFPLPQLWAYSLIWLGLILYTVDSFRARTPRVRSSG